jgi:hypothetical protein
MSRDPLAHWPLWLVNVTWIGMTLLTLVAVTKCA